MNAIVGDKAFTVGASQDSSYVQEWSCRHHLPKVECSACGETSWDEDVWYPCLGINAGSDVSKLSDELTVTVSEFRGLTKRVTKPGKKPIRLLPGGGIGSVHVELPKKASDFLWCGAKPLLSRRAADLLAKKEIVFTTGAVYCQSGKLNPGYLALQVPPAALYSDRIHKDLTIVKCEKCGFWHLKNVRVNLRGPREYVAERIPKGENLIKAEEGGETIATPRFVSAVKSLNLSGIEFRERGVFV